jgi:predicted lysophospholipase L1 biosynthesis ABC-type transport system permease subunit
VRVQESKMSIAPLDWLEATMAYIKSTLVGSIALFIATIVYVACAAYLALRNFTPPPGTEVALALGPILLRPSFWITAVAAFALGFYWEFRRA